MCRNAHGLPVWLVLASLCVVSAAAETRFEQTHSRGRYVHWIDLYDAKNRRIDPTAPDAPPYSPKTTCGRCHDYREIAHGYHFNAVHQDAASGRPGEPWIWTDVRTGTQIPLSYRGWAGTYDPRDLGISYWDFVLHFGRHLPGGGPGEPPAASEASKAAPAGRGRGRGAQPRR